MIFFLFFLASAQATYLTQLEDCPLGDEFCQAINNDPASYCKFYQFQPVCQGGDQPCSCKKNLIPHKDEVKENLDATTVTELLEGFVRLGLGAVKKLVMKFVSFILNAFIGNILNFEFSTPTENLLLTQTVDSVQGIESIDFNLVSFNYGLSADIAELTVVGSVAQVDPIVISGPGGLSLLADQRRRKLQDSSSCQVSYTIEGFSGSFTAEAGVRFGVGYNLMSEITLKDDEFVAPIMTAFELTCDDETLRQQFLNEFLVQVGSNFEFLTQVLVEQLLAIFQGSIPGTPLETISEDLERFLVEAAESLITTQAALVDSMITSA